MFIINRIKIPVIVQLCSARVSFGREKDVRIINMNYLATTRYAGEKARSYSRDIELSESEGF